MELGVLEPFLQCAAVSAPHTACVHALHYMAKIFELSAAPAPALPARWALVAPRFRWGTALVSFFATLSSRLARTTDHRNTHRLPLTWLAGRS
jgi:hypothetical protein